MARAGGRCRGARAAQLFLSAALCVVLLAPAGQAQAPPPVAVASAVNWASSAYGATAVASNSGYWVCGPTAHSRPSFCSLER